MIPEPTSRDDALMIEFLRERDVLCPGCSYNLRGLTSARCPECGRLLRLGIGIAEGSYLTVWVCLMAATCANAGIGCLFLMVIPLFGIPGRSEFLVGLAMLLTIATIPMVPLVVVMRRRFVLLDRILQLLLAGAACGILLLSLALFLLGQLVRW